MSTNASERIDALRERLTQIIATAERARDRGEPGWYHASGLRDALVSLDEDDGSDVEFIADTTPDLLIRLAQADLAALDSVVADHERGVSLGLCLSKEVITCADTLEILELADKWLGDA